MTQDNTDKDLTDKICCRLTDLIMENKLSNDSLVQIIEHCGSYLNLMTRSSYRKRWGISYNGAKFHRMNREIFGVKFIIDND